MRPRYAPRLPPGVEHGFIALADSVLETFGPRKVGSYTIVLEPDGTRRVVESFMQGVPGTATRRPGRHTPRWRSKSSSSAPPCISSDQFGTQ